MITFEEIGDFKFCIVYFDTDNVENEFLKFTKNNENFDKLFHGLFVL